MSIEDFYTLLKTNITGIDSRTREDRELLYGRARAALHSHFESMMPPPPKQEIEAQFFAFEQAVRLLEEEVLRTRGLYENSNGNAEGKGSHSPKPDPMLAGDSRQSLSTPSGISELQQKDASSRNSESGAHSFFLGQRTGQAAAVLPSEKPASAAVPLSLSAAVPSPVSRTMAAASGVRSNNIVPPSSGEGGTGWIVAARRGSGTVSSDRAMVHEDISMVSGASAAARLVKRSAVAESDRRSCPEESVSQMNAAHPVFQHPKNGAGIGSVTNIAAAASPSHQFSPKPALLQDNRKSLWFDKFRFSRFPKKTGFAFVALVSFLAGTATYFFRTDTINGSGVRLYGVHDVNTADPELAAAGKTVPVSSKKYEGRLPMVETTGEEALLLVKGKEKDSPPDLVNGEAEWSVVGDDKQAELGFVMHIPERDVTLEMKMRRNDNPDVPAAYIVELAYRTGDALAGDQIQKVPGIVIRDALEKEEGSVSLRGVGTALESGRYLVGLLDDQERTDYGLDRLRDGEWFIVPVTFESGSHGLFGVRKGKTGADAVKKVLDAWGYKD